MRNCEPRQINIINLFYNLVSVKIIIFSIKILVCNVFFPQGGLKNKNKRLVI